MVGRITGQNVRIDYAGRPASSSECRDAQGAGRLAARRDASRDRSEHGSAHQISAHDANCLRAVSDPVGSGIITSIPRPGGNITGFTQFEYSLGGKWIQLLREVAPRKRVAQMFSPDAARSASDNGRQSALPPRR